jgi:hypothetical protein
MLQMCKTLSEIVGPHPGERLNKHLERAINLQVPMKRALWIREAPVISRDQARSMPFGKPELNASDRLRLDRERSRQ